MSAESLQQPSDVADDYAATRFIIQSLLARVSTCTLVRVVACSNSGGLTSVGTVDVQPLVNQIAGDGAAWPHGQLYKLPYCRLQGGANAIILDPQPGDIGLVAFASRDISVIKTPTGKTKAAQATTRGINPGSARKFNMADGLYIGGLLNAAPEQYVIFNADGIEVVSPTKVRISAPTIELVGNVAHTGTSLTSTGTVEANVDVIGNGISLHDHVHGGVTPGGGSTAPPTP